MYSFIYLHFWRSIRLVDRAHVCIVWLTVRTICGEQISGKHEQERHFFLFDNILVYCKRTIKVGSCAHAKQPGVVLSPFALGVTSIASPLSPFYMTEKHSPFLLVLGCSWRIQHYQHDPPSHPTGSIASTKPSQGNLQVKGQIFTDSITILDLQDGDEKKGRVPVKNAFKIRNVQKDKW